MRKRVKEEFKGLDSKTYAQMKKDGIDFTEFYKFPLVCFMSDTNHKPFEGIHSHLIYQYPYIIVECTFLDDEDIGEAKKKDHIHWKKIQPHIEAHPECKFVLIHFSQKYSWRYVHEFFNKMQATRPIPIPNLVLWLHTGVVDYSKPPKEGKKPAKPQKK